MSKTVHSKLQARIKKSKDLLIQGKFKQLVELRPIAVYFKNARRVPHSLIRQALHASLPSWAMLRLDFIGSSVLEVSMDEKLKDRAVATLKMMRIAMIPNFNALDASVSRPRAGKQPEASKEQNLCIAVRRFQKNIDNAQNRWAAKWYAESLQAANSPLQDASTPGEVPRRQQRDRHRNAESDNNSLKKSSW